MATWEDGPEYAPVERPAGFTSPEAEPLEVAPRYEQPAAAAPADRPQFSGPAGTVPALAALVAVVEETRDPQRPFEVVSSNLTSGSAWGSAHGGALAGAAAVPAPLAPVGPVGPVALPGLPLPGGGYAPGALPVPAPLAPQQWPEPAPVPGGYPPAAPGAFPAPGTPQWFGPGPYGEQPPTSRVDARRVLDAATPGLLVVLGVGAVVFVLAPLMVAVAFALRSRVRAAQRQVRVTLGVALGAVCFFAAVGLARAPLDFSEWWSFVGVWSLLICWFTLITIAVLVHAALKRGPGAPPSYPPPWR